MGYVGKARQYIANERTVEERRNCLIERMRNEQVENDSRIMLGKKKPGNKRVIKPDGRGFLPAKIILVLSER